MVTRPRARRCTTREQVSTVKPPFLCFHKPKAAATATTTPTKNKMKKPQYHGGIRTTAKETEPISQFLPKESNAFNKTGQTIKPIPFSPPKFDLSAHKPLLERVGLWDYLTRVEFDHDIRTDLVEQLVINYRPGQEPARILVDGAPISLSRYDLASVLLLSSKKPLGLESDLVSEEDVLFLQGLVSNWLVLQDDNDCHADDVDGWGCLLQIFKFTRSIRERNPERVDWAGLIWFMVKRELLMGHDLGNCYYASHLQCLLKFQKPSLFGEKKYEKKGLCLELKENVRQVVTYQRRAKLWGLRKGKEIENGEVVVDLGVREGFAVNEPKTKDLVTYLRRTKLDGIRKDGIVHLEDHVDNGEVVVDLDLREGFAVNEPNTKDLITYRRRKKLDGIRKDGIVNLEDDVVNEMNFEKKDCPVELEENVGGRGFWGLRKRKEFQIGHVGLGDKEPKTKRLVVYRRQRKLDIGQHLKEGKYNEIGLSLDILPHDTGENESELEVSVKGEEDTKGLRNYGFGSDDVCAMKMGLESGAAGLSSLQCENESGMERELECGAVSLCSLQCGNESEMKVDDLINKREGMFDGKIRAWDSDNVQELKRREIGLLTEVTEQRNTDEDPIFGLDLVPRENDRELALDGLEKCDEALIDAEMRCLNDLQGAQLEDGKLDLGEESGGTGSPAIIVVEDCVEEKEQWNTDEGPILGVDLVLGEDDRELALDGLEKCNEALIDVEMRCLNDLQGAQLEDGKIDSGEESGGTRSQGVIVVDSAEEKEQWKLQRCGRTKVEMQPEKEIVQWSPMEICSIPCCPPVPLVNLDFDGQLVLDSSLNNNGNYHSPNGDLDRMTSEGLVDFNFCIEQMLNSLYSAKEKYEERQRECESAQTKQHMLSKKIEERNNVIQDYANVEQELQETSLQLNRLQKELFFMASALDGYKKALLESRRAFAEYRVQHPLPEEPLYCDVPGGGGLVFSTNLFRDERADNNLLLKG